MNIHKYLFATLILVILLPKLPAYSQVSHSNKRITDTLKKAKPKTTHLHFKPGIGRAIPEDKIWYNDCIFINKYNLANRLRKYPFSKASKIIAVSHHGWPPNVNVLIGQTPPPSKDSVISIINDKLDYSVLLETKQLTQKQINELTYIIDNTDYKVHNNYIIGNYSCFIPRNGFVFFDKNGKPFDYIEICFECKGYQSLSGKLNVGAYCTQKFNILRQFFIDVGIKYGTNNVE